MSSWVAPSVAAELWGISVQQVLEWIANGTVESYVDGHFLFVDIASRGYKRATPPPESKPAPAPAPEHEVVTQQELAALTEESSVESSDADSTVEDESESTYQDISQWRIARQNASRQRRPPMVA